MPELLDDELLEAVPEERLGLECAWLLSGVLHPAARHDRRRMRRPARAKDWERVIAWNISSGELPERRPVDQLHRFLRKLSKRGTLPPSRPVPVLTAPLSVGACTAAGPYAVKTGGAGIGGGAPKTGGPGAGGGAPKTGGVGAGGTRLVELENGGLGAGGGLAFTEHGGSDGGGGLARWDDQGHGVGRIGRLPERGGYGAGGGRSARRA